MFDISRSINASIVLVPHERFKRQSRHVRALCARAAGAHLKNPRCDNRRSEVEHTSRRCVLGWPRRDYPARRRDIESANYGNQTASVARRESFWRGTCIHTELLLRAESESDTQAPAGISVESSKTAELISGSPARIGDRHHALLGFQRLSGPADGFGRWRPEPMDGHREIHFSIPLLALNSVVTYSRRPDRRVMFVVRRSDLAAQASASAHRTGRIRQPVRPFRQSM
jgi:hypothetical protein